MSNTNTQIQRAIQVLNQAKAHYEREPTNANRERYIHVRSIFQRDPQIWEQIQREWQNPEIIEGGGGEPELNKSKPANKVKKSKLGKKGDVCEYPSDCRSQKCNTQKAECL